MTASGGQPVERHDAARIDDGGVEAGFLAFVQEHRVEGLAGGGAEAERDIGNPEHGPHTGIGGLDEPYALYGFDAVPAALFHARADRQGEGVEKEVLGTQAVTTDGQVVDGPGGPQLPLRRAGLAFGVDAGADDGGAVLTGQASGNGRGGCPRRRLPRG